MALTNLFKKPKEIRLISPDNIVFTVRDRPGKPREIKNPRTDKWSFDTDIKFSSLPTFEEYHAEQYRLAQPIKQDN